MARVQVTQKSAPCPVSVHAGKYRLTADEPAALGGGGPGPAPYDLLLGSLGACTAITLRMYAERKGWALDGVTIDLAHRKEGKRSKIERRLHLFGDLDDEQRARLADIAERTPVTLTLKEGADIDTILSPAEETPAVLDDRLDQALDESFPASDPPAVSPRDD